MNFNYRESQKQRELFFFLRFWNSHPHVPRGRPRQLRPPEPDIMVEGAGLGVEITEFYQEQNLKQLESEQQLVLEKARAMCEERGLPPMIVKVVWSASASTSKRERSSLAHQLVNAVAKNTPPIDSQIEIEQDGQAASSLPTMVDILGIERWSAHQSHHWFSPPIQFRGRVFYPKHSSSNLREEQALPQLSRRLRASLAVTCC